MSAEIKMIKKIPVGELLQFEYSSSIDDMLPVDSWVRVSEINPAPKLEFDIKSNKPDLQNG